MPATVNTLMVKISSKYKVLKGVLAGLPQAENYFPKCYLNISHLSSSVYSDTKLVNFDQSNAIKKYV